MSGLLYINSLLAGLAFLGISAVSYIAVGGIRYDDTGYLTAVMGVWMGSMLAYPLALVYIMFSPIIEYLLSMGGAHP